MLDAALDVLGGKNAGTPSPAKGSLHSGASDALAGDPKKK